MIICPKCKAEIEEHSCFCDQCGIELRYCTSCGKVGKGNRCTYCGGVMESLVPKPLPEETTDNVTKESTMAVPLDEEMPRLLLINSKQNISIEAQQNAVLGRRNGIYCEQLKGNPYISGTHARLTYNSGLGWAITDLNSSNGTYIDGTRILPEKPELLRNDSKVSLANMDFIVKVV